MQVATAHNPVDPNILNVGLASFERYRTNNKIERENIQKRTFTRWINSHISKVSDLFVTDLYVDLADGRVLKTLLEVLTGEALPALRNDTMGIYCLENLHKIILFLESYRVHLENIQPLDIYTGNPDLILGLIWIIILSFQVSDIDRQDSMHVAREVVCRSSAPTNKSAGGRDRSEALLRWCQLKTAEYLNVDIMDFTTSWKDGLAFNALIHRHRPDLISYDQLRKYEFSFNLNNAFSVAQHSLGIESILDPSDLAMDRPDSRSIITYVSSLYQYFSKQRADSVSIQRLSNILRDTVDIEKQIDKYNFNVEDLMGWIVHTTESLTNATFPSTVDDLNDKLADFSFYKLNIRPKRLEQKNDLEVLLLNIQSKMRQRNLRDVFSPREGETMTDVDRNWEILERVEYSYETQIKTQMLIYRRLEIMADKFGRSVRQCEDWVDLKVQELASFDQQCDHLSASIVIKRMELLQAEISLREPINLTLKSQVEYFSQQNYNLDPQVLQRFEDYNCKWGELVDKYAEISHKFSTFRIVEALSARIDNLNQEMDCIMANLSSFSFRNVKQIDALNDDSATLTKELDWTESCLAVLREDYEKVDNTEETDKLGEHLNGLESRMSTMREIMSVRTGKLRELQVNFDLSQSANEFYYWLEQQLILSTDNGDSVESTLTLINELKEVGFGYEKRVEDLRMLASPFGTIKEMVEKCGFPAFDPTPLMSDFDVEFNKRMHLLTDRLQVFKVLDRLDEFSDVLRTIYNIYSDKTTPNPDMATTELLLDQLNVNMDKCLDYAAVTGMAQQLIFDGQDVDGLVANRVGDVNELHCNVVSLAESEKKRLLCVLSYNQIIRSLSFIGDWISLERRRLASFEMESRESVKTAKVNLTVMLDESTKMQEKVDSVNRNAESWLEGAKETDPVQYVKGLSTQVNDQWRSWLSELERRWREVELSFLKESISVSLREVEEEVDFFESFVETDVEDADLSRLMYLRRRLQNFDSDMDKLRTKLESIVNKAEDVKSLDEEFSGQVMENVSRITGRLDDIMENARKYQTRMEEANETSLFISKLDKWDAWLSQFDLSENVHSQSPISDWENLLKIFDDYDELIQSEKDSFKQTVDFGRDLLSEGTDLDRHILISQTNALNDRWDFVEAQVVQRKKDIEEFILYKSYEESLEEAGRRLEDDETVLSIVIPKDFYEDLFPVIEELEEYGNQRTGESFQSPFVRLVEVSDQLHVPEIGDKVQEVLNRLDDNGRRLCERIQQLKNLAKFVEFKDLCDIFNYSSVALRDKLIGLNNVPSTQGMVNREEQYSLPVENMHLQHFDIEEMNPAQMSIDMPEYESEIARLYWDVNELKDEVITLLKPGDPEVTGSDDMDQIVVESKLGCDILSGRHAANLLEKCDELMREAESASPNISERVSVVDSHRERIISVQKALRMSAKFKYVVSLVERMMCAVEETVPASLEDVELFMADLGTLGGRVDSIEPMVTEVLEESVDIVQTGATPIEFAEWKYKLDSLWNTLKTRIQDRSRELSTLKDYYTCCVEMEGLQEWIELQSSFLIGEVNPGEDIYVNEWVSWSLELREMIVRNGINEVNALVSRSTELEEVESLSDSQRNKLKEEREELNGQYGNLLEQAAIKKKDVFVLRAMMQFFNSYLMSDFWFDQKILYAQNMEIFGNLLTISRQNKIMEDTCVRIRRTGRSLVEEFQTLLDGLGDSEFIVDCRQRQNIILDKLEDLEEIISTGLEYCGEKVSLSSYYNKSQEICDFMGEISRFVQLYLERCKNRESMSAQLMYKRIYSYEKSFVNVTQSFQSFQLDKNMLVDKYSGDDRNAICSVFAETETAWMNLNSLLELSMCQIDSEDLLMQFWSLHNMLMKWVGYMCGQLSSEECQTMSDIQAVCEENARICWDISAYDGLFDKYVEIGRCLVSQSHPRMENVSEAVLLLTTRRGEMMQSLTDREFITELLLDISMFCGNAERAEECYRSKVGYLKDSDLGNSMDQVERLIRRHKQIVESMDKYDSIVAIVDKLTQVERLGVSGEDVFSSMRVSNLTKRVVDDYIVDLKSSEKDSIHVSVSVSVEVPEHSQRNGKSETDVEQEVPVEACVPPKQQGGLALKLKRMTSLVSTKKLSPENTPPIYGVCDLPAHFEGTLQRKTVWANADKKALRRNWMSLYVVLNDGYLYFYKNVKLAKEKPFETFRGEAPWEMNGSFCALADDYVKHSFVFRLTRTNGSEYLFQAESQDLAEMWCNKLVQASGPLLSHASASIARTSSKARRR